MTLSACKVPINNETNAAVYEMGVMMDGFHEQTSMEEFEVLPRKVREEYYSQQMQIEKEVTKAIKAACHRMVVLQHEMGQAIDSVSP